MRLDYSPEIPRRREPNPSAPPIQASPIEARRECLRAIAQDRHALNLPRPIPARTQTLERPREPRDPSHTHPVEHRQRRDQIPPAAIGVPLREQEKQVLTDVGRFRVVRVRDLQETVYRQNRNQMERDLRYLREQGLVQTHHVNARRDGRLGKVERFEVVTLTKHGRDFVRTAGELPPGQKVYSGLVKPREVEHDAQIFRAYLKEATQIEKRGGTNLSVQLDFELKSEVQKAIHAARRAVPDRDIHEIKQAVANQFELPYFNGRIQIPDARIVYERKDDRSQGTLSSHTDIEVLTAAYRPGHIRAKAQSGFRVYASSADRSSLGLQIEDEHGMTRDILDL